MTTGDEKDLFILVVMTIVAIFAVALVISGCAAQPPQITVIYSVMPIDPPMQPVDDEDCVTFGFDGLACRDAGMRL